MKWKGKINFELRPELNGKGIFSETQNQINLLPDATSVTSTDILMMEESSDSYKKQKVEVDEIRRINIQEEGIDVVNTPHKTIDFVGSGITASDQGSGVAQVTILDPSPFKVVDNVGNQSITGVAQNLNLPLVLIAHSNYSIAANDEITIVAAGTYLVSYNITYEITNTSGSIRGSASAWLDNDDTGAWVTEDGSQRSAYHRETAGKTGMSSTFLLETTGANKKIRLRIERGTGSTNIDTVQWESGLSIIRIK